MRANTKPQNARHANATIAIHDKSRWTSMMGREHSFAQNLKNRELTCPHSLLLCWSRAKRDSFTWSAFYVHFGTANWLNFVPLNRRSLAKAGPKRSKLGFFVVWNVRNGWFFDIYIQGSKKIQL